MTEIERLARVLDGALIIVRDKDDGAELQAHPVSVVRAILQAMREPSEEMLWSGMQVAFEELGSPSDWAMSPNEMRRVWQAMIDHVLSEAP